MDSYNPGEDQIAHLYKIMYANMLAYAKTVLLDYSLAEEAVQDTFCIACMKEGDVLSSDNPNGWLMVTLQNVARNMKRQRASMNRLIMESLRVEDIREAQVQDEEDVDILYGDVSARSDFKLLKRIVLDGYSMAEAADELGITVVACKKRVQRAKQLLRKNSLNSKNNCLHINYFRHIRNRWKEGNFMSELSKKNGYDYSKYDEMSTEALEEILRLDFQMSEEAESDIDAILYISEVIANRKKDSPDVEAAWERFNTKYRPFVTDGRSLYDFGDEDNTPEATPHDPVAESDSHTFRAVSQSRRQRGPRRLVRLAIVAAILAAFLVATSATAYALGFDLWGTIAQWTKETFSFMSYTSDDGHTETNSGNDSSENEYTNLQEALDAYGVTECLLPSWIPEKFVIRAVDVYEDVKPGCIVFYTCYDYEDTWLTLQISMYRDPLDVDYTTWQKDDADVNIISTNGYTFYVMENAGRQSATWSVGPFECNITGDISLEELTKIIESICEKDE